MDKVDGEIVHEVGTIDFLVGIHHHPVLDEFFSAQYQPPAVPSVQYSSKPQAFGVSPSCRHLPAWHVAYPFSFNKRAMGYSSLDFGTRPSLCHGDVL